ncbi:MAG: hypothetical protein BWX45_00809 [Deltaproteobacteria bacterium ADurb.Bin002]|nr:MAG: hypothetical protein BWX45_00809 [Deltaproteobacteria bacterium ADurb.Bin002]
MAIAPVMEPQYIVRDVFPALKYSAQAMEILEGRPVPPISCGRAREWNPDSI